jgi:hypothetical protein
VAKNFRRRDLLMREGTELEFHPENMTQRDRVLCEQTAQSSIRSLKEKTWFLSNEKSDPLSQQYSTS